MKRANLTSKRYSFVLLFPWTLHNHLIKCSNLLPWTINDQSSFCTSVPLFRPHSCLRAVEKSIRIFIKNSSLWLQMALQFCQLILTQYCAAQVTILNTYRFPQKPIAFMILFKKLLNTYIESSYVTDSSTNNMKSHQNAGSTNQQIIHISSSSSLIPLGETPIVIPFLQKPLHEPTDSL